MPINSAPQHRYLHFFIVLALSIAHNANLNGVRTLTQPIPTAEIISAIAGVSKSTVSRALKGNKRISAKTRRRVMQIAEEMGYMPNAIARSLVTRESGLIGYVIGQTENLFYQEQVEKIVRVASDCGVQLVLFQVPKNGDITEILPKMLQYRLDGCVIIASVPMSSQAVATCARYRMPIVLLNRLAPRTSASSVLCANVEGGRQIADFLIAGGHKRIAFIGGRANSPISKDREAGFIEVLASAEQKLYASATGDFTFEGGYAATRSLVEARKRPDAIFAASDMMAFGALDAIRDAGLRAPDDVSVVGFDGARSGAWPAYNLTTIVQPVEAMFLRAVAIFKSRKTGATSPPAETVFIQGEFLVRGSARIPSNWTEQTRR